MPPSFTSALSNKYYVSYAADDVYKLPEIIDPDSSFITTSLDSDIPSFVSFDPPNIINIKPN
jgi:hypothetical protein